MTAPDFTTAVTDYLGDAASSWTAPAIASALASEKAAQAARCRVPADDEDWPGDLIEALCRRVAANLALRALPLGLQTSLTDGGASIARVGGGDAEVQRLEAPHRRLVLG